MIPDNRLARGIQSKTIRGRGAETPVENKAPHEPEDLWERSPSNIIFFCSDFDEHFFAYVSGDFKHKRKFLLEKLLSTFFLDNFFFDKLFFLFRII